MTDQSNLAAHAGRPRGLSPEEFDRLYRSPLLGFFLRRTTDRAEAEDLTQEVLLRTVAAAPASVGAPDSYIFTIAANLLRDRARRRATRHAERHASLDGDGPPLAIASEDCSAERVLIERERLRQALAVLDELPERTRNVFILFRVDKMRQTDIAARLGMSVSTVEKDVKRAIAHLARRLGRPA